jgi:hypothetical protein
MWESGNPGDIDLDLIPRQSLSGSAGFDESTTFRVPYASDVIESIVDQTFELGGFEEIPLPALCLIHRLNRIWYPCLQGRIHTR